MTASVKHPVVISVIMPVYNIEKIVSKSIESIINQTFSDFEFIIIDDCSTDGTWDIVQAFSDNRLITIRNDRHKGQYPTRNFGMEIAKGKYIAVMDGSNIALPDRFRKQYDYMEKNLDVLASGTQCEFIGLGQKIENPVTYNEICASLLNDNCFIHPSLLIRSEAIRKIGGYDEHYIYASEYDMVCRLCLTGRIENLPDTCIHYRWHPGQISQNKALEQRDYTDEIRQQYQIAYINKIKPPALSEVGKAETDYPEMGRVIGLYMMGECVDQSFRDKAEHLLDTLFDNINISTPLCTKKGLLGIGTGVIYLLRNHFAEGDEDEILENIDTAIFYAISYYDGNNQDFDWEGTFSYLRKRVMTSNTGKILAQLKIKNAIIQLLDMYNRYKSKTDFKYLDKELDCYCACNLFKNLISIYRNTERKYNKVDSIDSDSVTFVVPVRIDSEERRKNLSASIEHLLSIDNADIIILEADKQTLLSQHNYGSRVQYTFVKDDAQIFHRTKYLNKLLDMAKSPVVGIWDADVLISKAQMEASIGQVRSGSAIMSIPYNGHCYFLSSALSNDFRTKRSFTVFEEQKDHLRLIYGTYSSGGAFFVHKKAYCRMGGENENFYGWGAEDIERVKRMEILGYRIHRTSGALYHLYHPRNNSRYANVDLELLSLNELIKVADMNKEQLKSYIKWNLLKIPHNN